MHPHTDTVRWQQQLQNVEKIGSSSSNSRNADLLKQKKKPTSAKRPPKKRSQPENRILKKGP
jgi:hypothetical protein